MKFFCKREDPGNEVSHVSKETENNWSAVVAWLEISGPPSFPSMSQEKLFYLIHTMTQQNVYKRLTRTMSKYVETKAPSWLKKLIYFRLESTAV